MGLGVRGRLAALIALTALPMLITGVLVVRSTTNSLNESAETELIELLNIESFHVNVSLINSIENIEPLLTNPEIIEMLEARSAGKVAELPRGALFETYEMIQAVESTTRGIAVIDRSGEFLGQTAGFSWEPGEFTSVMDSMVTGDAYLGDAFQNENGEPRVGIVSPIQNSEGEVVGAALLDNFLTPMFGLTDEFELIGETTEIVVLQRDDETGRVDTINPLRLNREAAFAELPLDELNEPASVVDARTILRAVDHRGQDVIAAAAPIENTNWTLVVKRDVSEAFALRDSVVRLQYLGPILALAVALFGWIAVVKPLGGRLRSAAGLAERMSSGNYEASIDDQSSDEVGVLSRSMDQLARDLADDIARREEVERRLRFQAEHDQLTGLLDRRCGRARLDEIAKSRRPYGLVFIDLDGFKAVNDTYGHTVGDEVIKEIAARLNSESERLEDAFAVRWGGDEFLLILENTSSALVSEVQETLSSSITEPVESSVATHTVGASFGHVFAAGGTPPIEALAKADSEMYRMKHRWGGSVYKVSPDAVRRVEQALTEDRIEAFLQPVVRLDDEGVVHLVSCEALVRLRTAEGELWSPGRFLPDLGEGEHAAALDFRVMDRALQAVGGWLERGVVPENFTTAFNVGPSAMVHELLVKNLLASAARHGVPNSQIMVEIPETVRDVDRAQIDALRNNNFLVAIDDVGCEHSNLARLVDIDADVAKLDRRWLPALGESNETRIEILAGLVEQCRTLGFDLVAEGIETEEQLDIVLDMGVRTIQGFLFAKPMHPKDFEISWGRAGGGSARLYRNNPELRSVA